MTKYNKLWASLVALATVIITAVRDGNVTADETAAISGAVVASILVYSVANKRPA